MRRLLLLRHADAANPPGVPDRNRPLSTRGLAQAASVGQAMKANGWLPDLVLCSDARRACETLESLAGAMGIRPAARFDAAIYRADAGDLLDLVRLGAGEAHCLLVVGHNPAMGELAHGLAGRGDPALASGYPPAGLAVFAVRCADWSLLDAGCTRLERFFAPNG